jgi:hypothetical protein
VYLLIPCTVPYFIYFGGHLAILVELIVRLIVLPPKIDPFCYMAHRWVSVSVYSKGLGY